MIEQKYTPHVSTDVIANDILTPFFSKNLTRKAVATIIDGFTKGINARVRAMLSFGPDEISRIARDCNLDEKKTIQVLQNAGGRCVSSNELQAIWDGAFYPDATDPIENSRQQIADEIVMMLHASRDGMRNKGVDTTAIAFSMKEDGGYENEAFGMLRTLRLLGYGYMSGPINGNPKYNLQAWMNELRTRVLTEEGWYDKTHKCDICLERYGKDATRKRDPYSAKK